MDRAISLFVSFCSMDCINVLLDVIHCCRSDHYRNILIMILIFLVSNVVSNICFLSFTHHNSI
jgi:hypothetical protein